MVADRGVRALADLADKLVDALEPGAKDDRFVAGVKDGLTHYLCLGGVVIHDRDSMNPGLYGNHVHSSPIRGSSMINSAPPNSPRGSACALPPRSVAVSRTIVNPR